MAEPTPVVIVGAGPVGLAAALDLGRRGIASVVVEREGSTAPNFVAKALTMNERTMEICRSWGIIKEMVRCSFPPDVNNDNVYCTALDGHLIGRSPRPSAQERTPPPGAREILRQVPQFRFERILADACLATGRCTILYEREFKSLSQDGDEVRIVVLDRVTGAHEVLKARYCIAADGAGSRVRRSLDIGFPGDSLGHSISITLRSADAGACRFGWAFRYLFLDKGSVWSNLTSVDGRDLWRLTLVSPGERPSAGYDVDAEVRRAFGPAIGYEILHVSPWRRSQCLIERYVDNRVIFAGDAAHTTSPTGGHGLNTGIGDALGIGWMLAAVLGGYAPERLLGAYEQERRPVALRNQTVSTLNYGIWRDAGAASADLNLDGPAGDCARRRVFAAIDGALQQEWISTGIALGYRYEGSDIIVPDGTPPTPDRVSIYEPTARPGHLAPNVWLGDGTALADRFGRAFVLLCFAGPPNDALVGAARTQGVPLGVERIGDPAAAAVYGQHSVLVRPDGHVAWRGDGDGIEPVALWRTLTGHAVLE